MGEGDATPWAGVLEMLPAVIIQKYNSKVIIQKYVNLIDCSLVW